jgi:hypothetical protein
MFLVSVQPMLIKKERNTMTHFVQPSYPTHHEGIERIGEALEGAEAVYHKFTSARSVATLLLAAVVSGLVLAANQLIDTWADGHLLAAWIALWTVAFAAIALAAGPIRRAVYSVKSFDGSQMYAAWSARRKVRIHDEKMWDYARQDQRLMADIMRAIDNTPDAGKWQLRA